MPLSCTARVWLAPAATLRQAVLVPIWVGVVRLVLVPSPSWPVVFEPQAQRVPSVRRATLWSPPAAKVSQLVSVPIWMGVRRSVVVPSPSCPEALSPQAQRVPSVRWAMLWSPPAATLVQVELLPILLVLGPVGGGAVTELAGVVVAPGPQGAVAAHRHAVLVAGRRRCQPVGPICVGL